MDAMNEHEPSLPELTSAAFLLVEGMCKMVLERSAPGHRETNRQLLEQGLFTLFDTIGIPTPYTERTYAN